MRKRKILCGCFRSCPRGQKEAGGTLMTPGAEEGLLTDQLEKREIY